MRFLLSTKEPDSWRVSLRVGLDQLARCTDRRVSFGGSWLIRPSAHSPDLRAAWPHCGPGHLICQALRRVDNTEGRQTPRHTLRNAFSAVLVTYSSRRLRLPFLLRSR